MVKPDHRVLPSYYGDRRRGRIADECPNGRFAVYCPAIGTVLPKPRDGNRSARLAMEFAHEQAGDVVIVKLAGRLDSGAAQPAEESFTRVLAGGTPHLAIDLSNLQYISSAGLRVLLVVAKKVQQAKGKVVLFGLGPNVREVFSISGFDKIFAIQADSASAVAALR